MIPDAADEQKAPATAHNRMVEVDSLVSDLAREYPLANRCELRISVLKAEEEMWPKKDRFILLDRARELLRLGTS
jgi:hypothetical protein